MLGHILERGAKRDSCPGMVEGELQARLASSRQPGHSLCHSNCANKYIHCPGKSQHVHQGIHYAVQCVKPLQLTRLRLINRISPPGMIEGELQAKLVSSRHSGCSLRVRSRANRSSNLLVGFPEPAPPNRRMC